MQKFLFHYYTLQMSSCHKLIFNIFVFRLSVFWIYFCLGSKHNHSVTWLLLLLEYNFIKNKMDLCAFVCVGLHAYHSMPVEVKDNQQEQIFSFANVGSGIQPRSVCLVASTFIQWSI